MRDQGWHNAIFVLIVEKTTIAMVKPCVGGIWTRRIRTGWLAIRLRTGVPDGAWRFCTSEAVSPKRWTKAADFAKHKGH